MIPRVNNEFYNGREEELLWIRRLWLIGSSCQTIYIRTCMVNGKLNRGDFTLTARARCLTFFQLTVLHERCWYRDKTVANVLLHADSPSCLERNERRLFKMVIFSVSCRDRSYQYLVNFYARRIIYEVPARSRVNLLSR